ncbi:hypothetical protein B0H16DRAFT_880393 [Mycena metata]|uniref:Uncharacterized protein n=1 Tax=Mycena metata TaxID=1033252 RepID=A0AAD7NWR5_9AGAR|nr:hypothetical protein B0H16DRAFT_880393 [Mycena metata]
MFDSYYFNLAAFRHRHLLQCLQTNQHFVPMYSLCCSGSTWTDSLSGRSYRRLQKSEPGGTGRVGSRGPHPHRGFASRRTGFCGEVGRGRQGCYVGARARYAVASAVPLVHHRQRGMARRNLLRLQRPVRPHGSADIQFSSLSRRRLAGKGLQLLRRKGQGGVCRPAIPRTPSCLWIRQPRRLRRLRGRPFRHLLSLRFRAKSPCAKVGIE